MYKNTVNLNNYVGGFMGFIFIENDEGTYNRVHTSNIKESDLKGIRDYGVGQETGASGIPYELPNGAEVTD